MDEDTRSNDFVDYQNPYMFMEMRTNLSREQYDERKALYPSLDQLQPGITQQVTNNKNLNNLKFKLRAKGMDSKVTQFMDERPPHDFEQ